VTDDVGIGTAIVSYIEPHAGAAREFNRWYERDHFPAAVMAGPGAYSGSRWVATRECKAVRADADLFGDPDIGSYLSIAWLLPDAQAGWDEWVGGQVERLQSEDRMFAGRDHLHTAVYEYGWEARVADGPPSSMALDRGYPGLLAIAVELDPDDEPAHEREIEAWSRGLVDQELPIVVGLRRQHILISTLGEPEQHVLLLAFVDGDAISGWERVEPLLETCPGIGFAGPFFATVPGTDVFVEEL
jgi:hypothetical protein